MAGVFITLEGVEGVGKSTCVPHIVEFLETQGARVVTTREPGGTPLAESIRELLLWPKEAPLERVSELLLHFAGRRQHVAEVIEPALKSGAFVICDRFTDATHAYQGGGSGVPDAWIETLADMAHPGLSPDLTLLFDLEPEEGLRRIGARKADRYESESLAFLERVRQNYLARAAASNRFVVIDAALAAEQVRAQAVAAVKALVESRA